MCDNHEVLDQIIEAHKRGLNQVSIAAFEVGVSAERKGIIDLLLETLPEFEDPAKRAVITYLAKKIQERV